MIQAAGNYLLVEPIYEKKFNHIIIPDSLQKQVSESYGLVISIGPEFPYPEVKKAMKVLFRRNEGTLVEKYLALKPDWVLAIKEN